MLRKKMKEVDCILFDLDGTLLDTAQDFFVAVNQLREQYKLGPCEFNDIRSRVSEGAVSLAKFALALDSDNKKEIEFHRKELLEIYEQCCLNKTTPFNGVNQLLNDINNTGIKWGIVTNKPKFFAEKLVNYFFVSYEPSCLVCPEHTWERKPSPKGLLKACEIVGSLPSSCVYIGDHLIDIEAGKRAKITTIAAAYGYIPQGESCSEWNANFIAKSPLQIKSFIPNLN